MDGKFRHRPRRKWVQAFGRHRWKVALTDADRGYDFSSPGLPGCRVCQHRLADFAIAACGAGIWPPPRTSTYNDAVLDEAITLRIMLHEE
jgi:hypothetical protein